MMKVLIESKGIEPTDVVGVQVGDENVRNRIDQVEFDEARRDGKPAVDQ